MAEQMSYSLYNTEYSGVDGMHHLFDRRSFTVANIATQSTHRKTHT